MIRPAVAADLPALVEMGAAFHGEAQWASDIAAFDPDTFADLCVALNEHGVLLVADIEGDAVGMIGGGFLPAWFNRASHVAQELFLYVRPEHRRGAGARLMLKMIDECRARGATTLFASAIANGSPDVDDIYRRLGFAPTERAYSKVL